MPQQEKEKLLYFSKCKPILLIFNNCTIERKQYFKLTNIDIYIASGLLFIFFIRFIKKISIKYDCFACVRVKFVCVSVYEPRTACSQQFTFGLINVLLCLVYKSIIYFRIESLGNILENDPVVLNSLASLTI